MLDKTTAELPLENGGGARKIAESDGKADANRQLSEGGPLHCAQCGEQNNPHIHIDGHDFCSEKCLATYGDKVRQAANAENSRTSMPPYSWSALPDDALILPHQSMTSAFLDRYGSLVIMQEDDLGNDPAIVVIKPENIEAFVDRLCDVVGIPSAP